MRTIVLPRLLYQLSLWPANTERMGLLLEEVSPTGLSSVKVLRLSVSLSPASTDVPAMAASEIYDLLARLFHGLTKLQLFECHLYFNDGCCQTEGLQPVLTSHTFTAFESALALLYDKHKALATRVRLWFSEATRLHSSSAVWRRVLNFPLACTTSTNYFLLPTLKISQASIRTGSGFIASHCTPTHEVTLLMREPPGSYYTTVIQSGTLTRLFIAVGDADNSGLLCVAACAKSLQELSIVPASFQDSVSLVKPATRIALPKLRDLRLKYCARDVCDTLMDIMDSPNLSQFSCHISEPSLPKTFDVFSTGSFLERCPTLQVVTIACRYSPGMWRLVLRALERFQQRLHTKSVRLKLKYMEGRQGPLHTLPFGDIEMPSLQPALFYISLHLSKYSMNKTKLFHLPNVVTLQLVLDEPEVDLCDQLDAILSAFRLPTLQCLDLSVAPSQAEAALRATAKHLARFPALHEIVYFVMARGSVEQPPIPEYFLIQCAQLGIKMGYEDHFTHYGQD